MGIGQAGTMASGRFAPSPTGDLHLGNLRTALLAWLFARSTGSPFVVRMEDLDRVQASEAHERSQLHDLEALGLDWDGEVVRQSERFDRYEAAIEQLTAAGLVIANRRVEQRLVAQRLERQRLADTGRAGHLSQVDQLPVRPERRHDPAA